MTPNKRYQHPKLGWIAELIGEHGPTGPLYWIHANDGLDRLDKIRYEKHEIEALGFIPVDPQEEQEKDCDWIGNVWIEFKDGNMNLHNLRRIIEERMPKASTEGAKDSDVINIPPYTEGYSDGYAEGVKYGKELPKVAVGTDTSVNVKKIAKLLYDKIDFIKDQGIGYDETLEGFETILKSVLPPSPKDTPSETKKCIHCGSKDLLPGAIMCSDCRYK